MNKTITILTCGLAVATFGYIFSTTYITLILCFGITCLIVCLGFWIESKLKAKGSNIFNKIYYYISRRDKDYNLESLQCTYSYLGNNKFECKKQMTLKSHRNDLDHVEDSFCWSAPSNMAQIEATNSNHKIRYIHQEDRWTNYTVSFEEICSKNKEIKTGSIIKNLVDENGVAIPFYSTTIKRKTKLLVISVTFPIEEKPRGEVIFKIKPSDETKDYVGKPEVLQYDAKKEAFSKTIHYPRRGWKYIISWEKQA